VSDEIRLSAPQLSCLMQLGRARVELGPDEWVGDGWGNTLVALERRGLAEVRHSPTRAMLVGRITPAGERWLARGELTARE
jgi:hypothetical protein